MKRFFLIISVFIWGGTASAYDFSAVAPSGQTLYYEVISYNDFTVKVVAPTISSAGLYFWGADYQKPTGNVTIPSSVSNSFGTTFNVTEIAERAFRSCSDITSVSIPNGVTIIGGFSFWSCQNLSSVSIPNTVTSIGVRAFNGCENITNIVIPNSVTNIGDYAFEYCKNLTSITLSNNLTTIGTGAFVGDTSLASIVIPNSVTNIGSYAFSSCKHLVSVTMSNHVNTIDSNVFAGCWRLTEINIPSSVTRINFWAFNGCISLFNLVIPSSVSYIGTGAFYQVVNVNYHGSASTGTYGWGQRCLNGYIEDSICYTNASKQYVVGFHRLAKTATVPSSVERMKNEVLTFTELEKLVMKTHEPPTLDNYTGNYNPIYYNPDLEVIVPCDSYNSFMSAQYWNTLNILGAFDYEVLVESSDPSCGYVDIISSASCEDPYMIVEAVPFSGYKFAFWSDNNTESLRNIEVTDDVYLIAFFTPLTAINETEINDMTITSKNGCIMVSCNQNKHIIISDITGRIHYSGNDTSIILPVSHGVYLIRVDNNKSEKVIVY